METKHLTGKGEIDYDYENDILFLKVKNRTYDHSLELDDMVLDVDEEGYIIGIQLFGASQTFNTNKDSLQSIKKWEFKIKTEEKIISLQLTFEIIQQDHIVERGQNVIRETSSILVNSQVLCAAA